MPRNRRCPSGLASGYGGVIFARSPQITLANAAGVSAIIPEVTAHILVGLWADGSLVGCACVRWVHDSLAEIPFMAVRAEVRAQGLGSVLAAAAEKLLAWPGALAVHHVLMPAMARPAKDPSGSRPPAAPLMAAPPPSADAAVASPRALQETWGYALAPPAVLAALCQARWLRFLGVCMCVKRPDASCGEPAQPEALALAALRKLPPCLKLLPSAHLHAASRAGHVMAAGFGHAGMPEAGSGMQTALA
ncbi:hypothetical protein H632_c84p3 [Helicosporidium sp. ATCC 50920]|nr:hypothetical protein H632_c84p3 [Helicosporidium sp. ATCC 50920]|eukprot:KDD76861.1 hypothetical protein H632_c84p3 [Helicosporidium sp. ATCC 50920]